MIQYHSYRAILPKTHMKEFIVNGELDCDTVGNHYADFLERHPKELYKAWVDVELLWNSSRSEPKRIRSTDAWHLKLATLDLGRELSKPVVRSNVSCYEFPHDPEINVWHTPLSAMLLAVNKSALGIVWQFTDGKTISLFFSWDLFMQEVNRAITLPASMQADEVTFDQHADLFHRQRIILAYHLCNGLKAWHKYRDLRDAERQEEKFAEDGEE